MSMAARAALKKLLPVLIALLGGGCFRHHTIEPGTWRLTLKPSRGSEKWVAPPTEVEVAVDWAREEGVELVKVKYFPAPQGENQAQPYVLAGRLKEGKVDLKGNTNFWQMRIWGEVLTPQSMNGTAFARGRLEDDALFEGTWRMAKVRSP